VIFFDQPNDEPALPSDQKPADQKEPFRATVPRPDVIHQANFFYEAAGVISRRSARDKLEEIGEHCST
jgi:hypothetical protein